MYLLTSKQIHHGGVAMPDTADQILDIAEQLLQSRGFSAFSYADISKRIGTTKANIHYHFPSKAELGDALIDRYRSRYQGMIEEAEREGLTNREKMERYFQTFYDLLNAHDRICYGGTLGASYNALPEQMQERTDQMVREHLQWLADTLSGGREEGEFYYSDTAAETALMIVASLQGGLQIVRSLGPECFEVIITRIKEMIRF